MSESEFHVLIVGGGIGGLCLAQGLKKNGVSVAVYERDRSPDARLQGYRLNIEPIGSRALCACLPEALWNVLVATAGDPGPRMCVFDEHLRELMEEDEIGAVSDPARSHHAISRVSLRRLLLAGLEGIVHFDKQFIRFEQSEPGRVTAVFSDGSSATGHLLIGADGAHSRVRRQLLPDMGEVQVPAVGIGGKLPLTRETASWLPAHLQSRKNMILPARDFLFTAAYRRRRTWDEQMHEAGAELLGLGLNAEDLLRKSEDDDYVMWAFVAHRKVFNGDSAEPAAVRQIIEKRMTGWSPVLRRLIGETDPGTIQAFEFSAAKKPRPWKTTNVTLLGDALHYMPPVGGMGGNAALHDAELLCRGLVRVGRGKPFLETLHHSEALMLASGFAAVNASLLYTRLAISRIPLMRQVARLFFRTCGMIPSLRSAVFSEPDREDSAVP